LIARIQQVAQDDLFLIAGAADRLGLGLGPGQRRQKHARQDGDDGDDNEQFDQREGMPEQRGLR